LGSVKPNTPNRLGWGHKEAADSAAEKAPLAYTQV